MYTWIDNKGDLEIHGMLGHKWNETAMSVAFYRSRDTWHFHKILFFIMSCFTNPDFKFKCRETPLLLQHNLANIFLFEMGENLVKNVHWVFWNNQEIENWNWLASRDSSIRDRYSRMLRVTDKIRVDEKFKPRLYTHGQWVIPIFNRA